MLEILVYFHRGLWRVKRSDKELATFTNHIMFISVIMAVWWSICDKARMIMKSKCGIGIGQVDFFRAEDETPEEVKEEEIEADKEQLKPEVYQLGLGLEEE